MPNVTVHTGFWINHSVDPIHGATLTLPIRWGNYLIAGLSSLVAAAGVGVWNVCAYCLHQHIASKNKREILEQQLQVLLRTYSSAFGVLVDTAQLAVAWRGRAKNVAKRIWPLLTCAVVVLLGTIAAGIFVAEVASKSYQAVLVLAEPRDCGDIDFILDPNAPDGTQLDMFDAQLQYIFDKATSMRRYATYYYGNTSGYSVGTYFPVPKLPYVGSPVSCPFDKGGHTRCLGPNLTDGPAWEMDTGLLSSHVHFGVNAPPSDRIALRKRVTCAMIDPKNLTSNPVSLDADVAGKKINNTFIVFRTTAGAWDPDHPKSTSLAFNLDAVLPGGMIMTNRAVWDAQEDSIDNNQIFDSFNRSDADVAIWMVTQSPKTVYGKPVWDPMFLANVSEADPRIGVHGTSYRAGIPFSIAVCMDSWQLCNPNNDRCSEMAGSHKLAKGRIMSIDLGLNEAQKAAALRFSRINLLAGQFSDGSASGSTGLLAAELNSGREGHWLPANQWIREVELWFGTMLATMQDAALDWVSKPWPEEGKSPDQYITREDPAVKYERFNISTRYWDAQCRGQLFQSNAPMQNFSVLGLGLVIAFSVLAIAAGAWLPCCVGAFRARQARRGRLRPIAETRQLAHLADSKYHLLRLALERTGVEDWELGWMDIPVSADRGVIPPPMLEGNGLTQFGWKPANGLRERSTTMKEQVVEIEDKDNGNT